jgi:predicted RNase H-like HicB family nuclease
LIRAIAAPWCYDCVVEAPRLQIEIEREEDGRWIAEVVGLPGVMAYGQTREEALARTEALTLRVLADRLEHGERVPELSSLFNAVPA